MTLTAWIIFAVLVGVMLGLDLGVFHKKDHEISIKESLFWSAIWILVALVFNFGVYFFKGHDDGMKFLVGYVLERSLSIDNLFVFLLIFNYFEVPSKYQYRVLLWGIFGALVLRALFVAFGIALIHYFQWTIYVFGVILIVTGFKLAVEKDKQIEPEKNVVLKLFRKVVPVSAEYDGGHFFTRKKGLLMATPLFIVLLVIETTDVIFAVDSIPAVLAITTDPFIVYSSNVFAILGLRALYFALAAMMRLFHHLHYGLALILIFVGVKMGISKFVHIPISLALGLILGVLALSIIASIIWPQKAKEGHAKRKDIY